MKGSKVASSGRRLTAAMLAAATIGSLGGCATLNGRDPLEGLNRATFAFNEALDTMAIRPVSRGYETMLPAPIRTGIMNFFSNIADVFVAVNNLLQGKPFEAAGDAGRVAVNTTIGILGFLDLATDLGLEKHEEDFGQTLGRWGAEPGPYLVVPVYGPRDIRDTIGLVLDVAADPVSNVAHVRTRNVMVGLRLVSDRAALLPADKVIEEAALDKYSYVRDAYLQRRRNLIFDGRPPREPDLE